LRRGGKNALSEKALERERKRMAALGFALGSYTYKGWWAYFYAEMLEMLETLEYEDEDEDMSDTDKVAVAESYADGRVDKMRKASSANGSRQYSPRGGEGVSPKTANNKKRKRNMSENGHNPDLRKPTSRPHVGDMTSTGEVFEAYKPKPANSVGGLSLKVILTMTWDGKTFTMEYTPSIGSDGRVKLSVPRNRYGEVGLSAKIMNVPRKTIELAKKETSFWTKKEVFREKSEVASMEIKFVKL